MTPGRGGYALIEVAVAAALSAVVVAALYLSLGALRRFYAVQAAAGDARDAARVAAGVLVAELRSVGPAGGDLYAVATDSVALRSTTGVGVICSVSGDGVSLWRLSGSFGDAETDSALVFLEWSPVAALDDRWLAVRTREVRFAGSGVCPNGKAPNLWLRFDRSVDGAAVGAPVRGFRPYAYKLYRGGDRRWWLGQRLRNGGIQPLAGPFAAPGDGGLALDYRDSAGRVTADVHRVALIRLSIRTRSSEPVPRPGGAGVLTDTLSTAVHPRNP